MENQDLIAKIQTLKAIKPRQDWVFQTKARLFAETSETPLPLFAPKARFIRMGKFFPFPSLNFKPVFATLLLIIGIIGIFVFFFVFLPSQKSLPQPVEISQGQNQKELLAALAELQTSLGKIEEDLDNLKIAKSPTQALLASGTIKYTAQNVKEQVEKIEKEELAKKESFSKNQVLASLAGLKKSSENLIAKSQEIKKGILHSLIEDLKSRSLSAEDQKRLEKAITAYNEGRYDETMVLVLRISNK